MSRPWPSRHSRNSLPAPSPNSMTRHSMFCLALLAGTTLGAQQPADLAKLQDDAVRYTREYLRINTTNPPGNEVETMRWFARIFQQEGIPFDTASSAPGRGNIWARL